MIRSATALAFALIALLSQPEADTIRLVDGTSLENVQVVSEGLKEVVYKEGNKDKTVDSATVAAVVFEKKPKEVDEAEGLISEDDLEGAVDVLDAYVSTMIEKKNPGVFKWAPAYAAWKAVEVRARVADVAGQRAAGELILKSFAESRYLPHAYLAKASAELQLGQAPAAQTTLGELAALVESQGLGKRWELECKLAQLEANETLKGDARRTELEKLAGEAREFAATRTRAQALVGESFLADARASSAAARDLRTKASAAFQRVIDDKDASREALAAAYCGLGESQYLLGADADDKAQLEQGALALLRVITTYRESGQHVSRALFLAMRCFDLMQDSRRKADMRGELLARFPASTWAAEAKK